MRTVGKKVKIAAEGYDLKVLEGAAKSLREAHIDCVMAELGLHGNHCLHIPVEGIEKLLASFGYDEFGVYDQQLEWSGRARLRHAKVCFCNERTIVEK